MTKDLLERECLTAGKFFIGLTDGLHRFGVAQDFECLFPRIKFFIVHDDHPCRIYLKIPSLSRINCLSGYICLTVTARSVCATKQSLTQSLNIADWH